MRNEHETPNPLPADLLAFVDLLDRCKEKVQADPTRYETNAEELYHVLNKVHCCLSTGMTPSEQDDIDGQLRYLDEMHYLRSNSDENALPWGDDDLL